MIEITATTGPRTFIPRSGYQFYVDRPDALLIMCKRCGGCMSIVFHVQVSEAKPPIVKQCKCVQSEE